jgi:beta-phosphoglucomutase
MLKALLFDLDGTLTETDHIHMAAWQELLASQGIMVDKATYDSRISGRANPLIIREFLPYANALAIEQLVNHKEAIALKMMQTLEPVTGLHEVLHWQVTQRLQVALVTNATNATVPFVLKVLGLDDVFKIRILAEDVQAAKPDPIHYQTALERLGVTAEQAIVFEDSPTGVRSAVGAGIKVVGLTTSQPESILLEAGVSLVIDNFNAPNLWELLRTFETT